MIIWYVIIWSYDHRKQCHTCLPCLQATSSKLWKRPWLDFSQRPLPSPSVRWTFAFIICLHHLSLSFALSWKPENLYPFALKCIIKLALSCKPAWRSTWPTCESGSGLKRQRRHRDNDFKPRVSSATLKPKLFWWMRLVKHIVQQIYKQIANNLLKEMPTMPSWFQL